MLKKSASFVLASLRGASYETKYDFPHRSLRPRWTAFLNILRALLMPSAISDNPIFPGRYNGFSTAC